MASGQPPYVATLVRRASDGVLQRFEGPLHFVQEDPQLPAKPLRLRRGDRPLLGRPDEPLLLQDSERVPDVMLIRCIVRGEGLNYWVSATGRLIPPALP